MWRTSEQVETFAGAFSLLLAYGLNDMLELFESCYEQNDDDEEHHIGYRAFANLTLEQKVWTVHTVAFALLNRETPVVPLTAYSEAAVATIFRQIEELVFFEIDILNTDAEFMEVRSDLWYDTRRAILATLKEVSPDYFGDDKPLTEESEDMDEWENALESIEESILWDMDYKLDNFEDGHPDHDAQKRKKFGIDDDYFSAIPDDPLPAVAKKLLQEAQELCDKVIKREENKLCSHG